MHMKTKTPPPTSISLAIDACAALCGGEIDLEGRGMEFLIRLKKSGWTDHEIEQVVRGLMEQQKLVETSKWQDAAHR